MLKRVAADPACSRWIPAIAIADNGVMTQIGVNVAGAVSLWTVGAVAAWYSNKGRGSRPKAPVQEAGL